MKSAVAEHIFLFVSIFVVRSRKSSACICCFSWDGAPSESHEGRVCEGAKSVNAKGRVDLYKMKNVVGGKGDDEDAR